MNRRRPDKHLVARIQEANVVHAQAVLDLVRHAEQEREQTREVTA